MARMNRAPANVIGGRSSRPILIKIHVEPQIRHSTSQTKTLSDKILGMLVKTQTRLALF